ncbi:hypothetical protein LP52_14665 [Streptomonospora alba]|uniref:Uncharacterized protein n=1 Tax=Streptomonospora alba TaxID=183763 RepID=A0A0C2JH19_9ACTN|nr:hypothetical protein [Streptomonospora alba]KIH98170.1 hypothetical protein LP52_14665 [Streptomonospora alba]
MSILLGLMAPIALLARLARPARGLHAAPRRIAETYADSHLPLRRTGAAATVGGLDSGTLRLGPARRAAA